MAHDSPPERDPPLERGDDALSAADRQAVDRVPRGLSDDDRPLMVAALASILLHALFILVAYTARLPDPNVRVAFDESRGVALMAQIGYAAPDERPEPAAAPVVEALDEPPSEVGDEAAPQTPDDTDDDSAPDDTDDETDDADDTDESDVPDDADDATPDDAATDEPEPQPEASDATPDSVAPTPVAEAPRPARPRRPRPEPAEPPATEASETTSPGGDTETAAAVPEDPSALPPRRRYPEGTVNPIATDIGMWGPEGARSVAIVRNDRIRASTHRDAVESIFGALADYRHMTRNTSLRMIDDVDVMMLASSDPTDMNKTFIAAVHRLEPGYLMSELRRGFPSGVRWEERDGVLIGRPGVSAFEREFYIPTDRLLIFTRPEYMDDLRRGAPRPQGLAGALERSGGRLEPPPELDALLTARGLPERPTAYDPGPDPCGDRRGIGRTRCNERVDERTAESADALRAWDAQRAALLPEAEAELRRLTEEYTRQRSNGARTRARGTPPVRGDESWLSGILQVGELAGAGDDGPAIVWTFSGFSDFHIGGMPPRMQPPMSVHASLTLSREPVMRARFVFSSSEDASAFRRAWTAIVTHNTFALMAVGLYEAFERASWEIDHDEAIATIRLPRNALGRIAVTVGLMGGG